jgi:hypothetical protein
MCGISQPVVRTGKASDLAPWQAIQAAKGAAADALSNLD